MAKKVILFFVLAVLVLSNTFAFQFSPLEQTFTPTGADSVKSYTIVNDSDDAIAVMVSALVRDQAENGEEINADASRYFSIVPYKIKIGRAHV